MRTPFVVTIHDLILLDEPRSSKISTRHPWIFWVKYEGYRSVLSRAINRAQKVITVSHATADSVMKHFPSVESKKVEIVYEGTTALAIEPLSPHPSLKLRMAGHPLPRRERGPYLLYVGNAYPHKNLERLLEAFHILRETHPKVTLILAGHESIFYDRLLAGSRDPAYSKITFVKNPTDAELTELYQQATLFVFPSRVEGFGLPPLEAMSMGVPVAASDIPALREILGDAAVFFNPNDPHHIASVLSDVLVSSEKREQLITKGAEQIKKFSWNTMVLAIQHIYETCGKTET